MAAVAFGWRIGGLKKDVEMPWPEPDPIADLKGKSLGMIGAEDDIQPALFWAVAQLDMVQMADVVAAGDMAAAQGRTRFA